MASANKVPTSQIWEESALSVNRQIKVRDFQTSNYSLTGLRKKSVSLRERTRSVLSSNVSAMAQKLVSLLRFARSSEEAESILQTGRPPNGKAQLGSESRPCQAVRRCEVLRNVAVC